MRASINFIDMNYFNQLAKIKTLLAPIALLLISPGLLAAETESSSIGNVVLPRVITPEKFQQCVEPTDIMRRDHMKFLLQQRDATVIDGIRTEKYSLTGCINCHAQPIKDGKIVRAGDPEYFCTACHRYTSVKIDCFECHSDRPAVAADQLSRGTDTHQQLLAKIESIRRDDPIRSRIHKTLLQQVVLRVD
jgi:hypothetical protein